MERYTELLNSYVLFAGLTPEQISKILSMAHTTTYQSQDVIIQEGDTAQNISIITEGAEEVFKIETSRQSQQLLAHLTKGAIIGEMSLLDNAPRTATIRAQIPTTTLDIPIKALRALANIDSLEDKLIYYKIVENIARENCVRLCKMDQMVADLLQDEKVKENADASKMNLFMGCWRF